MARYRAGPARCRRRRPVGGLHPQHAGPGRGGAAGPRPAAARRRDARAAARHPAQGLNLDLNPDLKSTQP